MQIRTQILAGQVPKLRSLILDFHRDERGATAIEYALIATLICVVVIGALTALGTTLSSNFLNGISSAMQDAVATSG